MMPMTAALSSMIVTAEAVPGARSTASIPAGSSMVGRSAWVSSTASASPATLTTAANTNGTMRPNCSARMNRPRTFL